MPIFGSKFLRKAEAAAPPGELTFHEWTDTECLQHALSITINMPTVVNTNDLLLMFVSEDLDYGDNVHTFPSDFTIIADDRPTSSMHAWFFGKIADGSEGGTTREITTDRSDSDFVARVCRISGHTLTNILDLEFASFIPTSSNTSLPFVELTPTWGQKNTLWITSVLQTRVTAAVITWQVPYDVNGTQDTCPYSSSSIAAGSHRFANVASENPPNASSSDSGWRAMYTIGIEPAS